MQFKDRDESGALYIVPDPNAVGGKSIVRRPHPPPTTFPLDDDFDAYTVDTEWVPRQTSTARTSSHAHLRERAREDQRRGGSEYRQYIEDQIPEHNANVEEKRRVDTVSSAPASTQGQGQALNAKDRTRALRPRVGSNASLASTRRTPTPVITRAPVEARDDRAQNPRPGFEMVQQHVLEDGPERTVTVWREQVARRRSKEEEHERERDGDLEVSVYYQGFNGGLDVDVDGPGRYGRAADESGGVGMGNVGGGGGSIGRAAGSAKGREGSVRGRGALDWEKQKSPLRSTFPPTTTPPRASSSNTANTANALSTAPEGPLSALLARAQPPLTHLASTLANLGVHSAAHLRAIARLRADGGAYAEVRGEALHQGVTVVEWAILMGCVEE